MTETRKKRGRKYWLTLAGILVILLPAAIIFSGLFVLSSGVADNRIRAEITKQIAKRLNTRAELGQFHFDPWRLRVILADLTDLRQRAGRHAPVFAYLSAGSRDSRRLVLGT